LENTHTSRFSWKHKMRHFIFRNQVLPEIQQGPKDILALDADPNILELFLKYTSNKNSSDIFLDKGKLDDLTKRTVNLDLLLESSIAANRQQIASLHSGITSPPT